MFKFYKYCSYQVLCFNVFLQNKQIRQQTFFTTKLYISKKKIHQVETNFIFKSLINILQNLA